MNLLELQKEVWAWSSRNFGDRDRQPSYRPLLGVGEEVGELNHVHLKNEQGIRLGFDRAGQVDAIGDIVIYLADYCAREGLSLDDAVTETWAVVKRRNWLRYPITGRPPK